MQLFRCVQPKLFGQGHLLPRRLPFRFLPQDSDTSHLLFNLSRFSGFFPCYCFLPALLYLTLVFKLPNSLCFSPLLFLFLPSGFLIFSFFSRTPCNYVRHIETEVMCSLKISPVLCASRPINQDFLLFGSRSSDPSPIADFLLLGWSDSPLSRLPPTQGDE